MNDRGKVGLRILACSVGLGVLGDGLLRVGPWGINALIWITLLLGTVVILARGKPPRLERRAALMIPAALVAAGGCAWRDSEVLLALDFLSLCVILGLGAWQARWARLALGGLVEQAWRIIYSAANVAIGCIPMFADSGGNSPFLGEGWRKRIGSVVVGLLLAFPLLLVFGLLLTSADAVFESWVEQFVRFDKLISHALFFVVFGWLAAGYLQTLLYKERREEPSLSMPQLVSLGPVEIGVAVGLLNLLFLAFVVIQFRYLFGSSALVEVTPGLTYSEYARRGFFELVAVAALALAVLLAADWLLGGHSRRAFRFQSMLMVTMLFVILASALHRMRLYQAHYGWTQSRLYSTVFMIWIGALLLWFLLTVHRARRERFTFGALAAGYILIIGLHVLNPDAWIVRRNLELARTGRRFDAAYAVKLSADAFPVLASAWPALGPDDRQKVAKRFESWKSRVGADWRTWCWSRMNARAAIATPPN